MNRGNKDEPVLSVSNLTVEFRTEAGILRAVDNVSFDLWPGEVLGIVGESGSGKTVTVTTVVGLIPRPPGNVVTGEIRFRGRDLLRIGLKELNRIRGKEISMIFQDPMTSFNPVMRIGHQIRETLLIHQPDLSKEEARQRVEQLLSTVGVPDAAARYDQYPHEYSGGMRQRAMIAMAIANQPQVLIADEPTTALDVTVQAQVLDVLRTARQETSAAIILITHDLGLVAEIADRVVVMYGGRVVEVAPIEALFEQPRHPYTLGLLASLPRLDAELEMLHVIPGQPSNLLQPPDWCGFHPRCSLGEGRERCGTEVPILTPVGEGHLVACHHNAQVDSLLTSIQREIGVDPTGGAA